MEWTEGTVLLVSDRPIPAGFTEIPDSQLRAISGGAGYDCTEVLQEDDVIYCTGYCEGSYEYYPGRSGCETAPSGMCIMSQMLRSASSPCIFANPWGDCTVSSDWTYYYMLACS